MRKVVRGKYTNWRPVDSIVVIPEAETILQVKEGGCFRCWYFWHCSKWGCRKRSERGECKSFARRDRKNVCFRKISQKKANSMVEDGVLSMRMNRCFQKFR